MGLFNRNKKEKKIKVFINKKPGDFQIEDNYIKLTTKLPKLENIMFYKDIIDIKKGPKCVRIASKTEKYTISCVSDCKDFIDETYIQILGKVNDFK